MREHAQQENFDIAELIDRPASKNLPPFALALLPVLVVIVVNFAFIEIIVPMMDTSYLAKPLFGETTIEGVRGIWAVIVALFLAILVLIIGNWGRLSDLKASLDKGADASVLPIFNTASLVGFGAIIAAGFRPDQRGCHVGRRQQPAGVGGNRGGGAVRHDRISLRRHEYRP